MQSLILHLPAPWIYPMKKTGSQTMVHNWLEDSKNAVIADIMAPRILTQEEMEIRVAQALQKLEKKDWPKAGEVMTVAAMNADDAEIEVTEYESRWLK